MTFQIRRGPKGSLPVSAPQGQPLLTTDTNELYVGTGSGVQQIAGGGGGGAQGPTGPAGNQGPQGATGGGGGGGGAQGPQGATGTTGSSGPQGKQGTSGSQGATGPAPSGTPNKVVATDPSGVATNPSALRALVAADIPAITQAQVTGLTASLASKSSANLWGIDATSYGVTGNGYFLFSSAGAGPVVYYLTLTQAAISGTTVTYTGTVGPTATITNVVETSGSQVTLTTSGNSQWVPGQSVQLSGLTTATWLNGLTVTLLPGTTSTFLLFTDPTAHGTQATHADTGTAIISFVGYTFTITGFTNTGNNAVVTITSNTATTLVCTNAAGVNETHAGHAGSNVIDCGGGLFTTQATVGQIVFASNLSVQGASIGTVIIFPQGTITAVNSDTQIVCSTAATVASTSYVCLVWGDDQSTALTNAWNVVANTPSGGMLSLPGTNPNRDGPAVILVQSPQLNGRNYNPGTGGARAGYGAHGVGMDSTFIVPTPNFSFGASTNAFLNVYDGGSFYNFTIWGAGNSNPGAGLTAKVAVELNCADNAYHHDLLFIGWGANSVNGIGTGVLVHGGQQLIDTMDVDMFGMNAVHVQCGSNVGYVVLQRCQFWDCSGTALWVDGNSVSNPEGTDCWTIGCEAGNAAAAVVVSGGGVWHDLGSKLGLPGVSNAGFNNGIVLGYVNGSGGSKGTAYLTGTHMDSGGSSGYDCVYIDNSTCTCTASGCRFYSRSAGNTNTVWNNGGTFIDLGNTFGGVGGITGVFKGAGTWWRSVMAKGYVDLKTQAADIGSTTVYAVPALYDGMYRITTYIATTQAATSSSTMPNVVIGWTDDSSTAQSVTASSSSAANAVGTYAVSERTVYAQASSNIVYSTTSYASSGATPMQFSLRVRVEWMG